MIFQRGSIWGTETLIINRKAHPKKITHYVLIRGPSYGSLGFEAREEIRTNIREEAGGRGHPHQSAGSGLDSSFHLIFQEDGDKYPGHGPDNA